MQIPKFKDYITEAKTSGSYRLIIISDEPENDLNFHTAKNLMKQADKLGHKSYIYRNTGGFVTVEDDGEMILSSKEISLSFTPGTTIRSTKDISGLVIIVCFENALYASNSSSGQETPVVSMTTSTSIRSHGMSDGLPPGKSLTD